jgi:glutathione peroxidase
MSGILSVIGQFIYPLRKQLNRFFNTGTVLTNKNSRMSPQKTIYDFTITGIDGNEIDLHRFKGKKMLLVNTASECGFTPQYASLQKLHELYKEKLVVIGFPSNNFGAQEPGDEKEILSFCERNYGVTFPLTEKIDVTGANQHPLFKWLTKKELNGWNEKDPNWNFCKYLVDENGVLINFFSHKMDPQDLQIISRIEQQPGRTA